ncbi:hypothetical protein [Mycobacterium tuberculosis]|uniref:hypothetical protein n=1 Tax=Mycobacterium tuberculosis TaxID=1773 RepID=UPI00272A2E14|nr:hypothetical protein [Mycobacterium tuberculosis]
MSATAIAAGVPASDTVTTLPAGENFTAFESNGTSDTAGAPEAVQRMHRLAIDLAGVHQHGGTRVGLQLGGVRRQGTDMDHQALQRRADRKRHQRHGGRTGSGAAHAPARHRPRRRPPARRHAG